MAVAPPELKEPVYEYSFTPVNLKEINAFALPGGPMFVHRGMFDAAAAEGEVVGVMAHELAHVLLRHGTANASKAQNPWLQLGQIAGVVGGAVVGGAAGSAIAQGSQFGLGTLLLRYSRDFEKQADLLGAQIMARAGYDPRALARMFETIERESKSSGGSGPQWMSSHPNPGNRTQYITKEAELLTIASAADDTRVRADQDGVRVAAAGQVDGRSGAREGRLRRRGAAIGRNTRTARATDHRRSIGTSAAARVFQASVPSQLDQPVVEQRDQGRPAERLRSAQRADGLQPRRRVRRRARPRSRDLRDATNAWLKAVAQGNPELRLAGSSRRCGSRSARRSARRSSIRRRSAAGAHRRLHDVPRRRQPVLLPDDRAGERSRGFQETFQRIGESIRLTEAR